MKINFQRWLCSGALLSITSLSCFRAEALPLVPFQDNWTLEKVEAPKDAMPFDEALLALVEATSINVLADAAQLPMDLTIKPFAQQYADNPNIVRFSRRHMVISNVMWQGDLTHERTTPNTYLFWHTPDIKDLQKLQNLIVAWQSQLDARYPLSNPKIAATAWRDYLVNTKGWNPAAAKLRVNTGQSLQWQPFVPEEVAAKIAEASLKASNSNATNRNGMNMPQIGLAPEVRAELSQSAQGVEAKMRWNDLPTALRDMSKAEFTHQVRALGWAPDYRQFQNQWWSQTRLHLATGETTYYGKNPHTVKRPVIRILPIGLVTWLYNVGNLPQNSNHLNGEVVDTEIPLLSASANQSADTTLDIDTPKLAPGIDLSQDADLQKTVTFSTTRMPLRDWLKNISAQSGIALSIAADATPALRDAQLIAGSAGMKAADALNAVARLYDARWEKEGETYVLRPYQRDELHRMMARLGYRADYAYQLQTGVVRDAQGEEVAKQIYDELGPQELESKEGAAFSDLSPELQDRVLQLWRMDRLPALIVAQQRLDDAMAHGAYVKFAPVDPSLGNLLSPVGFNNLGNGVPLPVNGAGLTVFGADDLPITGIFPDFAASKLAPPGEIELATEKYYRDAAAFYAQQGQNR